MINKTICNACGSDLAPEGSRFCPNCGSPLPVNTNNNGDANASTTTASSSQQPHIPLAQAEPVVDVSTVTYDEATTTTTTTPVVYTNEGDASHHSENNNNDAQHQPAATPHRMNSPPPSSSKNNNNNNGCALFYSNPTPEMLQRSQQRCIGGVLFIETSGLKGKFTMPREIHVGQILGGVHMNASAATFVHAVTTINVGAILGGVKLTVPRGVKVETAGVSILGTFASSPATTVDESSSSTSFAAAPQYPTILVRGATILGAVHVKVNHDCPPVQVIP